MEPAAIDMLPASSLATCRRSDAFQFHNQIQAVGKSSVAKAKYLSWRLANEANNLIGWETVPAGFEGFIRDYMFSNQYLEDFKLVIDEAINYCETTLNNNNLPNDANNVWVFDIDETLISNLPYFTKQGFGSEALTSPLFFEWVATSNSPLLPESLRLYNKVVSLGIKVVLLTGRKEYLRDSTVNNLKSAGFHTWDKLLLRSGALENKTAEDYKSTIRANLEKQGYRIVGNIGDQWSDLLGPSTGNRVFKLPNPMYYIP